MTTTAAPAAKSGSSYTKIEPLTKSNYGFWALQVELACEGEGLVDMLFGKLTRDATDTDKAAKWDIANARTKLIITHSVTAEHYVYITKCRTANEMWLSIKKSFSKDANLLPVMRLGIVNGSRQLFLHLRLLLTLYLLSPTHFWCL